MAKQSQLDKAIQSIDADIAVLEAAKARLVKQRDAKVWTPRKSKSRAVVREEPRTA